jgi:hypothetical protein
MRGWSLVGALALVFGALIAPLAAHAETPEEIPGEAAPAPPADPAGVIQAAVLYDSRYDDTFYLIDGYKPFGNPGSTIRPYVGVTIARDARSALANQVTLVPRTTRRITVPVPLLYGDNYGLVALGMQYADANGVRVFLQAGAAGSLGVAAANNGADVRGGISLERTWGATLVPGCWYGSLTANATYLTRYSDTLAYAGAELARNLGTRRAPVEIFGRFGLSADARSLYTSNLAELTAGIRVHPFGRTGPVIAIEGAVAGHTIGVPAGVPQTFGAFRPQINFSSPF